MNKILLLWHDAAKYHEVIECLPPSIGVGGSRLLKIPRHNDAISRSRNKKINRQLPFTEISFRCLPTSPNFPQTTTERPSKSMQCHFIGVNMKAEKR